MAVSEVFTRLQNTLLGIQAVPGAGLTSVVITDIRMFHTNSGPQRSGVVDLLLDGVTTYTVSFTLTEEAIDQRTIQGYTKRSNPNVAGG